MLELFQLINSTNIAIVLSIFAFIVSLRANSIAKKSIKLTENIHNQSQHRLSYEKRSETLSEIDTQHALLSNLSNVTYQTLFFFNKNPSIFNNSSEEIERLKKYLETIENMQSKYNKQRKLSEQYEENENIAMQEKIISEIRKLNIKLTSDLRNAESQLVFIKEQLNIKV